MTETEWKFFANSAEITIIEDPDGTPTEYVVGIAKNCEVNVTFEHVELYGFKFISRQGVSKHTARVEVNISSAAFDPAFAEGISKAYALTLDPDDEKGALDDVQIIDTNRVALMNIRGEFLSDNATHGEAGGIATRLLVKNVYWESLPFTATENEYITFELSGYGDDVEINPVTPESLNWDFDPV